MPPPMAATSHQAGGFALLDILSAVQETAYNWSLATDEISWQPNAHAVLGLARSVSVATGAAFSLLIAPEHADRRLGALMGQSKKPTGLGTLYRVQYRFMPAGRRSDTAIWIEDHGIYHAGPAGEPGHACGVMRVISDRYQEEQRLLFRSDHDELTGQLNRIRLIEALGSVLSRAEQAKGSCGLLIAGINNLAMINETFGYEVGDEVIAATGRILKTRLRGGDTIGRYSSNKFGIILNECGLSAIRTAADRLMTAVRETPIKTSASPISASVSIGGVLLPEHARTVQQAVGNALQALDRTKSRHQDCFTLYEASPNRESIRRRNVKLADEIVAALNEHRLYVALQPIVSTKTLKPVMYECLLRMEKPDGTEVSAGEFIEVAEQLGLSRLIDRRTLELSIDILKQHPSLCLSLNVSSLTTGDHEWLVALHRLTSGRRSLTERLTIEITETTAIHDLDQSVNFVDTLKELGCKVAIDDFGAGYTSFRNLKFLGVNMVKIDGSFVKNLADDKDDRVFVKSFIELAEAFGIETVAEWVGDERTAKLLIETGVTYMQGYHFGKPQLAADLLRVPI